MASRIGNAVAEVVLPFVVFGLLTYSWYIYVFRVCSKWGSITEGTNDV